MNVKELQIGDYVNYRGQIIKITSLYDKGGSNEVGWSDKEDVWVNAINVEPIPLTEEILKKNGFKYFGYEELVLGTNKYCFVLQKGADGANAWWWEMFSSPIIPINHVHELQHIFRLLGIEKKIKL